MMRPASSRLTVLAAAVLALSLSVAACQTTGGTRPVDTEALANGAGAASLIAGNSGRLIGKVKGPIAFQVETNASGLIAQGTSRLIAPGTSRMRLLQAADLLEPAPSAKVELTDVKGSAVSYGPVTTDAEGSFSFRKLKPSTATIVVTASYTVAGHALVLKGAAPAPRKRGTLEATLTPASTLVVKKALEMVRLRAILSGALTASTLDKLAAAIAPAMDAKSTVAATLYTDAGAARTFDELVAATPGLQAKLRTLVAKTPLAELVEKTPETSTPEPSVPTPSPSVSEIPVVVGPAKPVEDHGVFTMAGSGTAGYQDGPQQNARFNVPYDVATDAQGNIYVADSENHAVRKVTASGMVVTLAGNGLPGFADGLGKEARLRELSGVACDSRGFLYVTDTGNHCIRRIAPNGLVTTIAGDGTPGLADGNGKAARFNRPTDLTVDAAGNLYVSDEENHAVRKVAPDGTVTTLAGGHGPGFTDGDRASSQLNMPSDVAIDVDGTLYVADTENHAIRKLTPDGQLTTLAGNGHAGYADATGASAQFDTPYGLVVDDLKRIYVADANNHRVRLVAQDGSVTTFKGTGTTGYRVESAEPGLFNLPSGAAIRRNAQGVGEVYIADAYNHRIRKFEVPIVNESGYVPK